MIDRKGLVLALGLPGLALSGAPARAWEEGIVAASGPMSDRDFYRATACEVPPGEDCALPLRGWPAARRDRLKVAIAFAAPEFPAYKRAAVEQAILNAVDGINAVGADLRLGMGPADGADIRIYLTAAPEGGTVTGTGAAHIDGRDSLGPKGIAHFRFRFESRHAITDAHILVSKDIASGDIRSVMLEELVQSLGLSTDLLNAYDRRRSIFARDGNAVTRLRGQDAMALRTHYPR